LTPHFCHCIIIPSKGSNIIYWSIKCAKKCTSPIGFYNGQGDVAILTDNAGNTVASYIFDAYGNTDSENTVYNPFGYRGEYSDAESGLIYLRARMYDPSTGRFINEDPIRDGLNWYVYCGNNPVMFVDPWGLADRYVNSDTSLLNMRSAPGTQSTVISTLPGGTTLDYQGNKTGVIDGHMWAEVSVNGQTGWVAATYLTDEAPSTTTMSATTNANGYIYPLASRHTLDPNSGGRMYGAPRGGGRLHAGMDLIVPSGTRVVAMTGGIVIENNKGFYAGTDALIVKNSDGTTVLYGEIKSSLGAGTIIKQGQTIGSVIANNATGASMLHIEYYTGEASGSIFGGGPYRRRSDLTSPMFIQYLP